MIPRLFAFVPCAPRPWISRRGLHSLILDEHDRGRNGYVSLLLRFAAAAEPGRVGMLLHNPFGRGPYTRWPNGLTSMRADQVYQAFRAGYGWLAGDLIEAVADRPHSDVILYVGSYPDMHFQSTGLETLWSQGFGLAFDGASASTESVLIRSVRSADRAGRDGGVWIESTPHVVPPAHLDGLPIIAEATRWRLASRKGWVTLERAPRPSIWWWRGDRDEFVMSEALTALELGHALCVRLDRLDPARRRDILRYVAELENAT